MLQLDHCQHDFNVANILDWLLHVKLYYTFDCTTKWTTRQTVLKKTLIKGHPKDPSVPSPCRVLTHVHHFLLLSRNWREQLWGGRAHCGLWFQPMVPWFHCFWVVLWAQWGVCGGSDWLTLWKIREREGGQERARERKRGAQV